MISSVLDFYYKNFGFSTKASLFLAGYLAYRYIMIKSFTIYDFVKLEDVEAGDCFGLSPEEAAKFKGGAKYLLSLKAKLGQDGEKLYGMIYENDQPILGGMVIFHANLGIVNLTNQDIRTDKHGIVVTKSVLTHLSQNEFNQVLAHEVGHAILNHVTRKKTLYRESCIISFSMIINALTSLLDMAILSNTLDYQNQNEVLKIGAILGAMLVLNYYLKHEIRKDEFAADRKSIIFTKNKLLLESALKKLDSLHQNFSMDQLPEKIQGIFEEKHEFYDPSRQNNTDGWTLPGQRSRSHTNKFFVYAPKPNPDDAFDKVKKFFRPYHEQQRKILGIFEPYFSTHPTIDERIRYIKKLEIMPDNRLLSSKETVSEDLDSRKRVI